MRVALLTSFWDRPAIESITIDYYAELRDASPRSISLYAAYSAETQVSTVQHAYARGWELFYCPSAPLGLKLNTAMRALGSAAGNITHVITLGSDDLAHPYAFDLLCDTGERHPAVGFVGTYFLCTQSWRAAHFKRPPGQHRRPSGAGRILQRRVLEQLNWSPRSDARQRGLDASMDAVLAAIGVEWSILQHKHLAAPVVDVKTARNIWPFDRMLQHGAVMEQPDVLCAAFGSLWAERLRALHCSSRYLDPKKRAPIDYGSPAAYLEAKGWTRVAGTNDGKSTWTKESRTISLDAKEPDMKAWRRIATAAPADV